jgi:glycosyltransferase involved in cell wall biosynthesis
MCIDLCTRLRHFYPKVGVIFALPDIGDHQYYDQLVRLISSKQIDDHFVFQHKPCQFYPILAKSDVFVRPTNTDGDAVSLREALFFNVPSVASNAVPRPEGTVLFETRDNEDLFRKVKNILDNYELYKTKLQAVTVKDNFEEILTVYRSMDPKKR